MKDTKALAAAELPAADLVELPPADKRVDVPGFEGATAWLNVDHALTQDELKGRVVVVDFWTSCCINCLHTIPVLQALEAKFRGQPLVVVGVHSPKFDEEREADRLRDVLAENRIEHPVAVDGGMKIWHAWGVDGWPTVAVLDVEGRAIWAGSGEPSLDEVSKIVASAIAEGARTGKLARGELKGLAKEKDGSGALKYPGKVLALAGGGLAIADTGHDRVVLLDKAGAVDAVVGSGLEGKLDGGYGETSFKRPQGMTEVGDDLFVADTGNHTIRKIDRKQKRVTTVAGTGEIGNRRLDADEVKATSFALRSPWDLLELKGTIYVALAGSHQIGAFDPVRGTIRLFAGNGVERREDGPLMSASFAQPSALATDGSRVFVLDSETSSVRAIDPAKGQVSTLVGEDLFVFGDVDGDRQHARLQHPIGMAYADGALWVADSYNSKLKRVDAITGLVKSVLGGPDRKALNEPAGVSARGGTLFIADTNHHRIVRFTQPGGAEAIAIAGLVAPASGVAVASAPSKVTIDPRDPSVSLGTLSIPPGKATRVDVAWNAPRGTGVNDAAPFRVVWTEARGLVKVPDALRAKGADVKNGFSIMVEPAAGSGTASVAGVLDLVICDEVEHKVCVPVRRTVRATFQVKEGTEGARARIDLPEAK